MRILPLLILPILLFPSCSRTEQPSDGLAGASYSLAAPKSLEERLSYSFGYILAASAEREYGESIKLDYVVRGAMDYAEGIQQMSHSEMNQSLIEFQQMQAASQAAMDEESAARNAEEAAAFLEANSKRSTVHETETGLQYEVVESGNGTLAKYASYERGRSSTFSLSSVIPGFEEGIRLMREGDTYRFWIPPELGYGEYGAGSIEPNSLLIFDVHLIRVLN